MTAGLGSVQYPQYTGLARLQRHNLAVKAELKVIAPKVISLVITQPPSPPTLHHTDLCVNESCDSDIAIEQFKLQPPQLNRFAVSQNNTLAVVSCCDGQHYLQYLRQISPSWL